MFFFVRRRRRHPLWCGACVHGSCRMLVRACLSLRAGGGGGLHSLHLQAANGDLRRKRPFAAFAAAAAAATPSSKKAQTTSYFFFSQLWRKQERGKRERYTKKEYFAVLRSERASVNFLRISERHISESASKCPLIRCCCFLEESGRSRRRN